MTQESLRQQMAKLRGKFPRTDADGDKPKTLMRKIGKVLPRTVVSGDKADAPKTALPKVKAPSKPHHWTDRAKSKIGIALREGNSLSVMRSVKTEGFDRALMTIHSEIDMIREKAIKEAKAGTSRELTAVRRDSETVLNLVKTIREGNRVNDVEVGHLPGLSKRMSQYLNTLRNSLDALAAPKIEKFVPENELINEANVMAFRTRYERQMTTALHEARDKPFLFINQPVLPVFEGVVKTSVLLHAGLPVEDMAGYPVLLNQKLLVLNGDVLHKRKIEDRHRYAQSLIERLNENSTQHFVMAHEPNQIFVRDGNAYYWLMPNDSYKIMGAAGGSNASVRQWGLAF